MHKTGTSPKIQEKVDQVSLPQDTNCKYLRSWLDPCLRLNTHTVNLKNKLEKHPCQICFLQKSGFQLYSKYSKYTNLNQDSALNMLGCITYISMKRTSFKHCKISLYEQHIPVTNPHQYILLR